MTFLLKTKNSFLTILVVMGIICFSSSRICRGQPIFVSNYDELRVAILQTHITTNPVEIVLTRSITLTDDLPMLKGSDVKIIADPNAEIGSIAINGDDKYRGLMIDATGNVEITGIFFNNCQASGGKGGDGAVGGGGGAGLGGAIYVKNGDVTLTDVSFRENSAIGGDGGTVLYDSNTVGGGGGLGGDGGSGATAGFAPAAQQGDRLYAGGGGGGLGKGASGGNADGSNGVSGIAPDETVTGGKAYSNGTLTGQGSRNGGGGSGSSGSGAGSLTNSMAGGGGGGIVDQTGSNNATSTRGGHGGYGGGGGGSTMTGGNGGFGGGGGGGAASHLTGDNDRIGGDGGLGGGGGGAYDWRYAGKGGIGAGNGGAQDKIVDLQLDQTTQPGGTGGGGLGAGGAVFVESGSISFNYSAEYYDKYTNSLGSVTNIMRDNTTQGGTGGGGTAGNGDALGSGLFLAGGTTRFYVAHDRTIRIADNISSVGAASNLDWNNPDTYEEIRKRGYYVDFEIGGGGNDGTLFLQGDNNILGKTSIIEGTVVADSPTNSAIGKYSEVDIASGAVLELRQNETIGYLTGDGDVHLFWTDNTGIQPEFGGRTLVVAGNEDERYFGEGRNPFIDDPGLAVVGDFNGRIVTDGNADTRERLIKTGTGRLTLTNDNTDTSGNNDDFETVIYQGTIVLKNEKGLGAGNIISKNIDFGERNRLRNSLEAGVAGLNVANDILIFSEETIDKKTINYNDFVVGGQSFELSGTITGGPLIVNMEDATTKLTLSNTDNAYGETSIYKGVVVVYGDNTVNSLGKGAIRLLEGGQGGISAADNGLVISQNIILNSVNSLVLGNEGSGIDYTLSGIISGRGGIDVNLSDMNDRLTLSGSLSYTGPTTITQGTLVAGNDIMFNGGLGSGTSGVLDADGHNVTISGSASTTFRGAIVNSGTITKSGTGTWTYDSLNILDAITVNQGIFAIGSNATTSVQDVNLAGSGQLKVTQSGTTLQNLTAANTGTNVSLNNGTDLTLLANGGNDNFYATFTGNSSTTVTFDGLGNSTWNLFGNSTSWQGTMIVDSGATVNAKWYGALGDGTSTVQLNGGTLGVAFDQIYSMVTPNEQIARLNVTADSTVDIASPYMPLFTKTIDLAGGTVLTKKGSGYLVINGGPQTGLNGIIDLNEGGLFLQKYYDPGTSTEKYDSDLGNATLRVSGSNTSLGADIAANTTKTINNDIEFNSPSSSLSVDVNASRELELSGTVSGAGSLLFGGDGTKTLSGNYTGYSGNTVVNAGTLNLLSDMAASHVFVENGALLNTDTTRNLGGLNLASGSILQADISGGFPLSPYYKVNGDIWIENGAIGYIYSNGGTTHFPFTLIDATGATNNRGNLSLIDDVVGWRATGVWNNDLYEITFQPVNYLAAASTFSQTRVAAYLTQLAENEEEPVMMSLMAAPPNPQTARSPELDNLLNWIESLSDPQARYVYDEISGQIYNSLGPAQVQLTTQMFGNIARQLRTINQADDVSDTVVRGKPGLNSGWTGWVSGLGMFGDTSSNHAAYGYDFKAYGGLVAIEPTIATGTRFGIFYAYNNLDIDTDSTIGSGRNSDNFFGLYGLCLDSLGYTSFTGGFGFDRYKVGRTVMSGTPLQASLNDSFNGWQGGLYVERGLPMFQIRKSFLQPYLGLQYLHLNHDEIRENGNSIAALYGKRADMNSFRTNLGTRLTRDFSVRSYKLQLEANADWMHEFGDDNMATTFRFGIDNPATFISTGNSLGRDWGVVGVGANFALYSNLNLFGSYDFQLNKYQTLHVGNFGLNYSW